MGSSKEGDTTLALHGGGDAVSEELGLGSEFAEDSDLVDGGEVVECGHGGWWETRGRERVAAEGGCVEHAGDSPCSAM